MNELQAQIAVLEEQRNTALTNEVRARARAMLTAQALEQANTENAELKEQIAVLRRWLSRTTRVTEQMPQSETVDA